MYTRLLIVAVVLNSLAAGERKLKHFNSATSSLSHGLTTASKNNVASHHNITYVDKTENMLLTPNINKFYEQHKKKIKAKKTPKRTIQKIIKKNRGKLRKIYITKKIKQTTPYPKIDYEKIYADENKQWREEKSTTQANHRRKIKRKYTPKLSSYHMPFQRLQKMEHRHKRDLSRELYILKDLDEMQFLNNPEHNGDVVKAHVQKFW